MAPKESPEDREKRKKRCGELDGLMLARTGHIASLEVENARLFGQPEREALFRLFMDSAATVESFTDLVAQSNIPILDGLKNSGAWNGANVSAKGWAVAAIYLDVANAVSEYQSGGGWSSEVTLSAGNAGANAFALFNGSKWAKGLARNPWLGVGVGGVSLAAGGVLEYQAYGMRRDTAGYNNRLIDMHKGRLDTYSSEFDKLNCHEEEIGTG